MKPWRPMALAALLTVSVGVGAAVAQTVIVTNAPPGSTIELVLNEATVRSATANPGGEATLPLNLSASIGRAEADAHVYVDVCGNLRRVVLVERGLQPPPKEVACDRKEIAGLYLVRKGTSLLVDLAGSNPMVWLRQGPVPAEWLRQGSETPAAARAWRPLPTGLVLSGGGDFTKFRDALAVACGNVTNCAGNNSGFAYTAGVAYWFTRFLAAEASYVRPAKVTANGSGDTYRFNSSLEAHVLTVAGKVGVPVGPVRFYGQAGADYHRATSSTTETVDDTTVTIDDVVTTIPGGTQTFELKTEGWGWLFGGGVEVWVARSIGIYAEVGRAALKGSAFPNGEGPIDDRLTFVLFGARFHIGR
jgi:hypothetical protein